MELASPDMEFMEFGVTDLASFFVLLSIHPRMNFQPFPGPGGGDQIDNDFQRLQRNSLPVARDMTE